MQTMFMEHQIRGMDQTAGQGIWTGIKHLLVGKFLQTRIYHQSQICHVRVCLPSAQCPRFCLTALLPCLSAALPQHSLLGSLPALQLCCFSQQPCNSPVMSLLLCVKDHVVLFLCAYVCGNGEGSLWSVYGEISLLSIVCPLLSVFIIIVEAGMYLTGCI